MPLHENETISINQPKKWRDAYPDYLRQYRAEYPAAVTRDRLRQQVRDQKPSLAFLEKNNLALDLKRSQWDEPKRDYVATNSILSPDFGFDVMSFILPTMIRSVSSLKKKSVPLLPANSPTYFCPDVVVER